ncbi:MAG TPA: FecR domain-containing protein [Gemmatimonadaceae bacterium]|nr:FecR domain-containing protein [Gemmatimonadaceae bacterium]
MTKPRTAVQPADDDLVDPDIALITDYLANELSAAESEAVEDRLLADEAFHEKVRPVIAMWTLPVRFRERIDSESRRDISSHVRLVIPDAGPGAGSHASPTVPAPRYRRLSVGRAGWVAAAALALIVARPVYEVRAYAIAAGDAAALARLDPPSAHRVMGAFVSTRQGEEKTVAFPNGSHVTLRPQSRLAWRALGKFPRGIVATLKGEATIDVTDAERTVFVGTMMGGVILRPGIYAVRCELGCTAMRVTVGPRGRAYLNGTGLLEWVSLGAGEHGEVRYPHWPTHTNGYMYPEITP